MNDFEIIEKAGVSSIGYSDAIKNALKNIEKQVHWFEIIDQRGRMTPEKKIEFQVVIKIGCK